MHTHWNDPIAARFAQAPPNVRGTAPAKVDDPNAGNVKRDVTRVIVFDGPGPSSPIVLNDAACYPFRFEGRFALSLVHTPSNLTIAKAEFYLEVQRTNQHTPPTGTFTPLTLARASLRTSVVQSGGVTSPPTYSILEWVSNQGQMSLI